MPNQCQDFGRAFAEFIKVADKNPDDRIVMLWNDEAEYYESDTWSNWRTRLGGPVVAPRQIVMALERAEINCLRRITQLSMFGE